MDRRKPTGQMLGRFQPWHRGHQELFKRILADTGQVVIMIREMEIDKNNPFSGGQVSESIHSNLQNEGFTYGKEYTIMSVPNIVNIGYGRDVGYQITQYDLGEEIHSISATKIRKEYNDTNKC